MDTCKLKIIILSFLIYFISCNNTNDENNVNVTENNVVAVTDETSIFSSQKEVDASTKQNTIASSAETSTALISLVGDPDAITTTESMAEQSDVATTENYFTGTTFYWHFTIPNEYSNNLNDEKVKDDIESLLLQNETQNFLSKFESDYQRDVLTTQLKFCPYTSLCGFSFGLSPPNNYDTCCKDCSCDFPACMTNKMCCPDIMFNHVDMFNSTSASVHLPEFLIGLKIQKDCIPLSMSKELDHAGRGAFGYTTCQSDTETELVKNCTRQYNTGDISDLADIIPVINRQTYDLYRNKYCALCNGVLDNQFEALQPRLSCLKSANVATVKGILNDIFMEGTCNVELQTEKKLDYCVTGISKCSVTGDFEESLCSMYRSVIYVNETYFQNVFCSLCNGYVPEKAICSFGSTGSYSGGFFSFSGLLKLDKTDSGNFRPTAESADRCSENQLYDAILDVCRELVCSDISDLSHGECFDIFEKLEKITYTAIIRLKPIRTLSIIDAYNVADDIIAYMSEYLNGFYLCGMQMLYKSNMTMQENYLYWVQNSSLVFFEIRVQYHVHLLHDPNEIVGRILKLNDSEHIIMSKHANENLTFMFEVRNDDPRMFDIISIISMSDELFDGVFRNSEDAKPLNLTFLQHNYVTFGNDDLVIFPHLRVSDQIGNCQIRKKEFDIFSLTRCPKVNISVSDLPWEDTDDGVTILRGNYVIKSEDYYFADHNHIMLCADQYRQYMSHALQYKPKTTLTVETIVSIVCSAVSILALCFTFFIFCFFSQLRQTIPGKNNMSLIFALLCAQSLYLIGSFGGLETNSKKCVILGIVIHFMWLVAIFWMNICTFHMFRVLARTKVISHSSGAKRLVMYHVYAQVMAAIFVSINIVLSHYVYGNVGYGGNACYISSQRMIMYTFGIPVGVIVICNILMFIFVIIKIKRSSVVQKSVQNERNDIIVFAKLSTITGATWVFGFLYILTSLTPMSYLFIIMNASQGVFIMFAFVINKRVIDLFKDRVLGLSVASSDSFHPTSKQSMYTSTKTS